MLKKVLVTVLTYPCPSHRYTETVCTAGVTEDGEWVRLYPIPLRFYDIDIHKYRWYEFDVELRSMKDDPRKESNHCKGEYPKTDMGVLGTGDFWRERKKYCVDNVRVFHTISEWEAAIDIDRNRYWQMAESMPYAFYYEFTDGNNERHKLMIEDWEAYALFLNCRRSSASNAEAISKVRAKYLDEFKTRDIYFFLGTLKDHHMRRFAKPYSIIGVFCPPKDDQLRLF